jgi:hypothetical protein
VRDRQIDAVTGVHKLTLFFAQWGINWKLKFIIFPLEMENKAQN